MKRRSSLADDMDRVRREVNALQPGYYTEQLELCFEGESTDGDNAWRHTEVFAHPSRDNAAADRSTGR